MTGVQTCALPIWITELDAVRAYIEALGGTVDVLARVGDWTVKVA